MRSCSPVLPTLDQLLPNCAVHLSNLANGRDLARPDRPDWLIGYGEIRHSFEILRQRSVQLCQDRFDRLPGFARAEAFTHAQDDVQAHGQRSLRLRLDLGVVFTLGVAALGMTDDGQARTGIQQHQRRRAARMGAFLRKMDVLPADGETWDGPHCSFDQNRRNAKRDINLVEWTCRRGDRADLLKVGREAVHLPIARDKFLQRDFLPLFREASSRAALMPARLTLKLAVLPILQVQMLSFFRRVSKSKFGTAIMAGILIAILAGFAVADIRNFGSGDVGFAMSQNTLAKVGTKSSPNAK